MRKETAKAIDEVVRVAYKQIVSEEAPRDLDITISRGPSWCGVEDDYVEVNEEKFHCIVLESAGMNEQPNIGDVVQLKSGGPKMTIEEIGPRGDRLSMALCSWFLSDNQTRKEEWFELGALKRVEDISGEPAQPA